LAIHHGKLFHAIGEYGNLIFSGAAASTPDSPSNADIKNNKQIGEPRRVMV
jgi:hypothetical protein